MEAGRRWAFFSVAASLALAVLNITTGVISHSTSVTAAGLEFAGDVLASLIVFLGMWMASRPADEDHPYGHGRFEILAGLIVGIILVVAGAGIGLHSMRSLTADPVTPLAAAIWAPVLSAIVKAVTAVSKFRIGRQIGSAALIADAWNDSVDILSATTAVSALALTLSDPTRFAHADAYGGFAVGIIVVVTGLRVVRDTSLELTDTMPPVSLLEEIRNVALEVSGVEGVEKCFARKTGFRYHVDLHIEVDPAMTVAESHAIAHRVQEHLVERVAFVAGVLVHIEPVPSSRK
ncbi:MAG: cation transporter [Bryobacteraceae bacterium]|nr:cation transporter [Bryobacteraceae bacterium]